MKKRLLWDVTPHVKYKEGSHPHNIYTVIAKDDIAARAMGVQLTLFDDPDAIIPFCEVEFKGTVYG